MIDARPIRGPYRLVLLALVTLGAVGCSSPPATEPPPLQKPDEITAVLPKGVTLDSPVVPNKLYGESSKTVQDALRSVHAYVRDRVLYEGGMGHQIRFDTGSPETQKPVKKAKGQPPVLFITLAK